MLTAGNWRSHIESHSAHLDSGDAKPHNFLGTLNYHTHTSRSACGLQLGNNSCFTLETNTQTMKDTGGDNKREGSAFADELQTKASPNVSCRLIQCKYITARKLTFYPPLRRDAMSTLSQCGVSTTGASSRVPCSCPSVFRLLTRLFPQTSMFTPSKLISWPTARSRNLLLIAWGTSTMGRRSPPDKSRSSRTTRLLR